ncbi:hypothetical protein ACX93W_12535 [Paenibacillus sp. CAU 1782]
MQHSLYIGAASDDRRTAYSWLLVNSDGVAASDIYLTQGERKFDENYGSHIALQRALRAVARQEGVIQLRLVMDETVSDAIGYELIDVLAQAPLYPTLCRTTKRIMRRFDKCELATFKRDETDATPQEISVVDDAIDALEQAATLPGTFRYWRDCLLRPNKIIR